MFVALLVNARLHLVCVGNHCCRMMGAAEPGALKMAASMTSLMMGGGGAAVVQQVLVSPTVVPSSEDACRYAPFEP